MAKSVLNLAVFISGRGSNLQSIIDACARADFPARIGLVISNIPNVYGLTRAIDAGIETRTVDHTKFESKQDFEQALLDTMDGHDIDLVCLAGFMRILSPHFIAPWDGRLINIHPSLLPAYKGLDTHKRAIMDGQAEAGCSVHFVTPEVDSGAIIVQKSVLIAGDDTPDTLAARVLKEEHLAYPEAIETLAKTLLAK